MGVGGGEGCLRTHKFAFKEIRAPLTPCSAVCVFAIKNINILSSANSVIGDDILLPSPSTVESGYDIKGMIHWLQEYSLFHFHTEAANKLIATT